MGLLRTTANMNASANPSEEEVSENEEAAVVPEDACSQVPKRWVPKRWVPKRWVPKRWVPKSKSRRALLGRSFSKSSVFSSFTARRSSSVIKDYSSSIYDEEDEAIEGKRDSTHTSSLSSSPPPDEDFLPVPDGYELDLDAHPLLDVESILSNLDSVDVPRYTKNDLIIQKTLGRGSFSDAFEVFLVVGDGMSTRKLDASDKEDLDRLMEAHFDNSKPETRRPERRSPSPHGTMRQTIDNGVVTSFCVRKNTSSNPVHKHYAMKCLRPNVRSDAGQFAIGITDLVRETAMLASLHHQNIITLHGRAADVNDGYFVLLDRLQDTLEHRLVHWKTAAGKVKKQPSLSQLLVASSIANALAYLHAQKIVFRDLKPANIGFDSMGQLKLFDFGFAKRLESNENGCTPPLYEIAGTRRYMAPEVALERGYGTPADVHSYGILLWEICALKKPFSCIESLSQFDLFVFEKGERPARSKHWPQEIKDIMVSSWSSYQSRRPTMNAVKKRLDAHILTVCSLQSEQATNGDAASGMRSVFRRLSQ